MASLVQSASNSVASNSSVTVTLSQAASLGNCLVVCVMNDAGSVFTVSNIKIGGSAGNFAVATRQGLDSYTDTDCEIWTDQNIGTSSTSVVVTVSGTATNLSAVVMEWSGIVLTGAVDKTNNNPGTSSSFSSGATGTLTKANEVIIACAGCLAEAGTSTVTGPSSPWTNLAQVTQGDTGLLVGYQIVTATTTQTYSGTCSGGAVDAFISCIISLEEQPAIPSSPTPAYPGKTWRRRFNIPERMTPRQPAIGSIPPPVSTPPTQIAPGRSWRRRFRPRAQQVAYPPGVLTVSMTGSGTFSPSSIVTLFATVNMSGSGTLTESAEATIQFYPAQAAPGRTWRRRFRPKAQAKPFPHAVYQGTITFTGSGTFTPTHQRLIKTLIVSIASAAGTDSYGNAYVEGLGVYGYGKIVSPEIDVISDNSGLFVYRSGT
jgi:hypothetical protein